MQTITVGPIGIFFTNKNKEMKLPGHSHTAEVSLVYLTIPDHQEPDGGRGFPVFEITYLAIADHLRDIVAKPIEGTNEHIARLMFSEFERWTTPAIDAWGGRWSLLEIILAVRGVRDTIGHADSVTEYTVSRTEQEAVEAYAGWRMTR